MKKRNSEHYPAITTELEFGKLLYRIDYDLKANSIIVQYFLKILPHIFVRPGDLRRAKWADIFFDEQCWKFTPSKTQTSYKIDMIVPFSRQVMKLFEELRMITGNSEYCFASAVAKDGVISDSSANKALKSIGFENGETTGHGFRATARTMLDEVLKFPIERIEQQLGHRVKDVNGRAYNRTQYLDERKVMMQAWSDFCDHAREKYVSTYVD